ncbi:MAG: hypothetical protein IKP28_03445 [Clostridia bacterium]|nr:hypothetical protein [Clostridia bacterium]
MKRVLSIALIAILLVAGLFILTGCDNEGGAKKVDGVEISQTLGKGTVTLTVPKNEDGTPKYEFTKTKPKEVKGSGTFYLETETAAFSFGTHTLVYNTATYFKEKHGEQAASFEGYLEWMQEPESTIKLAGLEQFEINGRKALRYYSRTGGSGDYVYHGYNYMVGVDDIYKGSNLDVGVYYKGDEVKESKEFDQETLDIINSLKVTLNAQ